MTDNLSSILELVVGLLAAMAALLFCVGRMERWMTAQVTAPRAVEPTEQSTATGPIPEQTPSPAATPPALPVVTAEPSQEVTPSPAPEAALDTALDSVLDTALAAWLPADLLVPPMAVAGPGSQPRHARQ